MKNKKVVVGMSGGVDSSLTAALLVEQGYEVTGVFLECWRAPGCRVDEDRKDAMDVAIHLKISFKTLDLKKEYRQKVVDYFYSEYKVGRTPNPDVMCNREIKFGMFYEWALEEGFDAVATGHYARIEDGKLMRGVDEKKDQSYFLYQLRGEQLDHIQFPLGEMTKNEVRKEAHKRGLITADKPDSQGICFIGEVSTKQFLKDLGMKERKGEVVMRRGGEEYVVGEHPGAWFFTVGQRHGFTIDKARIKKLSEKLNMNAEEMPGMYVVEKDVKQNRLTIGGREQLMRDKLEVSELHWISKDDESQITDGRELQVRIRHGGALVRARLQMTDDGSQIKLKKPVFGVAPGQAVVFYDEDVVLGGGIIL
jgi:tRNA-specific 2-thiouridylase